MALAPSSAALCLSVGDLCVPRYFCRPTIWNPLKISSTFVTGFPLLARRPSEGRKSTCKATLVSIRCEQSANDGNELGVWLGRLAMIGFAAAISVEIGTGKGILENFGLSAPMPTVALVVTALVGVLTAIFIFQSASKD